MGSYTTEEEPPSLPAIVSPTVYVSLGWQRPSDPLLSPSTREYQWLPYSEGLI